jgi:hypothetical protein
LKETDKKEQFHQLLRTKLLKAETRLVVEEWNRCKKGFIEAAEEICGERSGRRRYKETPWWTDRIKVVWRKWFKTRTKKKKMEKDWIEQLNV